MILIGGKELEGCRYPSVLHTVLYVVGFVPGGFFLLLDAVGPHLLESLHLVVHLLFISGNIYLICPILQVIRRHLIQLSFFLFIQFGIFRVPEQFRAGIHILPDHFQLVDLVRHLPETLRGESHAHQFPLKFLLIRLTIRIPQFFQLPVPFHRLVDIQTVLRVILHKAFIRIEIHDRIPVVMKCFTHLVAVIFIPVQICARKLKVILFFGVCKFFHGAFHFRHSPAFIPGILFIVGQSIQIHRLASSVLSVLNQQFAFLFQPVHRSQLVLTELFQLVCRLQPDPLIPGCLFDLSSRLERIFIRISLLNNIFLCRMPHFIQPHGEALLFLFAQFVFIGMSLQKQFQIIGCL